MESDSPGKGRMKIAYFDCFSGISGDMILGALVDAGVSLAELERELRKLPVSGWTIAAEKTTRKGMAATKVTVTSGEDHPHRHLGKILGIIDQANLKPRVAERAKKIFTRLGEAEARVHGVPVEKIHFHEVGAVDAIVDIVGAAIGFELAGLEGFACSGLNVGGGTVETAHGRLPVPAPATAELLRGAATYSTGIARELVTPTGAAIVTTVAREFGAMPAMRVEAIGCGAGTAELAEQPNVLRMFAGERLAREATGGAERSVTVIEANVDDMNPQIYGYFVERALQAGALDVFSAPVQMKKNRPGLQVTLVAEPGEAERLVELVFAETTTIGVRTHTVERRTLERELIAVETPLGTIRMKIARRNGTVFNAAPEFEDCQRIAAEKGIPLKQVLAEAAFCYNKRRETTR